MGLLATALAFHCSERAGFQSCGSLATVAQPLIYVCRNRTIAALAIDLPSDCRSLPIPSLSTLKHFGTDEVTLELDDNQSQSDHDLGIISPYIARISWRNTPPHRAFFYQFLARNARTNSWALERQVTCVPVNKRVCSIPANITFSVTNRNVYSVASTSRGLYYVFSAQAPGRKYQCLGGGITVSWDDELSGINLIRASADCAGG
jgi:hypothetical protein